MLLDTTRRLAIVALLSLGRTAAAQDAAVLPFGVGERLDYVVSVGRLGKVGQGHLWVDGTAQLRGHETMVLRFELNAGKGPVKASDRTTSWLCPRMMASFRYDKQERHPLSRRGESVELYPEARRWVDAQGVAGEIGTDAPLDELSFLYFLRTVSLAGDSVWRFDRHFDAAKNPTTVRVVGRRTVATRLGEIRTVELEMRVRDPRRYRSDEGIIRIDLSDDPRRLLVRMESTMPVLGRTVLLLDAWTPAASQVAARAAR
ncbi:MAG TPA: DUF3108 domain-containing protein [Gemmatimonadaceae bacterium]|nr:DUF3108 domain-containing protein [Gemmatimonadaceae bacterium]